MPCGSCNPKNGTASQRWEVTAPDGVKKIYTSEHEAYVNASKIGGKVKKVG